MPTADPLPAPVAAACASPAPSTAPSTSVATPTPPQDSGRGDNLEARMNEQSALIASLAQGMHEMLQQMKQLRLDAAAAASAPQSGESVASGAQAPAPAQASSPVPALGPPAASGPPPTPTPTAQAAVSTVPEEASQATPAAHGTVGAGGPRVMGPRGSQSGRPGAGRLASVAEAGAGEPVAHPPSMDGNIDAEAVHSAAQAHSAAVQGAGAGLNTGLSGRNPARQDTAACTPGEDPSRQLKFGQPLHPLLPHSGVSVMSHGQNTHANA
eukprot:753899-Pleurochrysis_carterae.AAC.1